MKSMRELMEAVMEGGKGPGAVFQDDKYNPGPGEGPALTLDTIIAQIARRLGWSRSEDAKSHPYLHDIQYIYGKVFPRVFTKSNVEFALYGILMDGKRMPNNGKVQITGGDAVKSGPSKKGGTTLYIVVAAKRRSASWNTRGEDPTGRDPHSVTYFRIPLVPDDMVDYDVLAQKVKNFTQQYKRANANSDGPGIKIVSEGGKGPGTIFQNDTYEGGPHNGEVEDMGVVAKKVARLLGWNRVDDPKSHPYLHDIEHIDGKVYPRVFTKSNVEFALFAIDIPKAKSKKGITEMGLIVAAKRRSASWNSRGEDQTGKDPHSVTYFRIPIPCDTGLYYEVFVKKIKSFTQQYKRANANSDGPGVKVTG